MSNELIPHPQRSSLLCNPETRAPCAIVVDTSYSTSGERIGQMNAAFVDFLDALQEDDLTALCAEVALITFGEQVKLACDFTPPDALKPPKLVASGGTPLAEAVLFTIEIIERRLAEIEAADVDAYKPWIYLVTDGEPYSPKKLLKAARDRIRDVENAGRIGFFAVGTDDADMDFLRWLSVRPPWRIRDMDYAAMFRWVAQSIIVVSQSLIDVEPDLPNPVDFGLQR